MSTNNIAESIFDSIALIVEKRIANLDYDKTIVCTIVSIDEEKNNVYMVTDGSTRFKVQGDGAKYQVDDQVRVLVPEGDFTKEKYIQGKHRADETTKPITYVSPLGSVLKITDNLLPNASGTYGIAANGDKNEVLIGQVLFDEDYIQSKDIFDTLYLKADFQTNFDQFDMREGDYGLHIKIVTYDEQPEEEESVYGVYGLEFSAKDHMFGNPYAFKIFTSQEVKYALSQWPENTVGLQLFLYQKNNFAYHNGTNVDTLVDYTPQVVGDNITYDIRVSNIELGFGNEVTNDDNKKLKLYTSDAETYRSDTDDTEDKRKLKLLWYNKTEDNEYIGFSDGIYDANYDEDEYNEEIALNNRLLARRTTIYPADKLSLTLAADIYDASAHAKTAATLIGTDLRQIVQGFKDYTLGIGWPSTSPFAMLLSNDVDYSIGAYSNKITNSINTIASYYDKTLQWAKDNEKAKPTDDETNGYAAALTTLLSILNGDNSVIAAIDTMFNSALTTINSSYTSYKSVYSSHHNKWIKLKETLSNLYEKINAAFGKTVNKDNEDEFGGLTDYENLTGIVNNTIQLSPDAYEDETTKASFKEQWNNRYCIYWYRKNTSITTKDKYLNEPGWERLNLSTKNIGLPSKQNDINYCETKTNNGLEVELRRVDEETFIVVMFHNHEKIISNQLIFNNLDEILDATTADAIGALYLEHNNDASKDSYQLYSSTGMLLNAADAQVCRQLRVRFNGESGKDEQLIGATVFWYVPSTVTMLDVFNNDIGVDFNTDRLEIYSNDEGYEDNPSGKYSAEDKLSADYDRGRYYSNRTYLVGPNKDTKKYLYYEINPVYEAYKNTEKYKVYNKQNFVDDEALDTDCTYLVKLHDEELNHLTYQLYQYKDESWTAIGDTFTKFICGDANSNYRTIEEWETQKTAIPAVLDITQAYIVGSIGGPYYYYHYLDNEWKKSGQSVLDLSKAVNDNAISKPGYNCYYKTIGSDGDGKVKISDTIFTYHVKDYYQQTATQNSILCVIEKGTSTFEASKSFTFSSFGNNGTDYTLQLTPNPEYPVITNDSSLYVATTLYDFENKPISLTTADFSWVGPSGYKTPARQTNEANFLTGCLLEKDAEKNCYNGILRCSISGVDVILSAGASKKLNLQTDISIPYGLTQDLYIEGASSIVYDSNGANPQYYKKPYVLYKKGQSLPILNITWSLRHYDKDGNEVTDVNAIKYQPRLNSETNVLIPHSMFIQPTATAEMIYTVAIASKEDPETGDTIVMWAQPIIITQNRHGSALLNAWDGGLKIDDTNGTILSTMVGAGRKNADNEFEGVLMGDVGQELSETSIMGLYGFNKGVQSFGLKVDGTAFLGKMGRGRIEFDGTSGTIESAGYKANETGLKIALADGYIDGNNFTLMGRQSKPGVDENDNPITITGSTFKISSNPEAMIEIIYKDLDNDNDSGLGTLLVGTNNYILRSFNWWNDADGDQPLTGMEIDIGRGIIQAYYNSGTESDYRLRIDASDSGDSYGEVVNSPLTIGSKSEPKFKVNWDGSMYSTAGEIGGWSIGEEALTKGVLTLDGTNGTIVAKNASDEETFKVDGLTGLLAAKNATLTQLTVVDTLLVKSPSASGNTAKFTVQGNTDIKGNITLAGYILMPHGDLLTAPMNDDGKTTDGAFISFGNGGGNIWVYGDFYIAANSSASAGQTGKLIVQDTAKFNKPDCILFGTKSLPEYIADTVGLVTEGTITSIGFAIRSSQLVNTSKVAYNVGSNDEPVYFKNGIPEKCTTTFATQSWVTGKNYLTSSSLSGYATESWVTNKGYLTSSSTIITTMQQEISDLKAELAALKGE